MATLEDVISTKDPEAIKRKRSAIQGMITTVRKSLVKLLAKTAEKFDHAKIQRLRVQGEHAGLKKHQQNFIIIHEAYLQYRELGEDNIEEQTLVEKQENHYEEVVDKIYESLQLYADYEESYKLYMAAQPDPEREKKDAEEKFSKEVLAQKLRDEEAVQKQEAAKAAEAEDDRIKKELIAKVVKREQFFKEAVGMYRTAKKFAEDVSKFAKGLSKEQVVSQVMEFAHVRSLPTYETKNSLLDRFKAASDTAIEWQNAIEEVSGIEEARDKVTFNRVDEDASVQDIVSVLDLLLNAKVEYNGKGTSVSHLTAAKSTPIKVRLNTPKFSGKSRDFAIYKKEFMDVIVPSRSEPEIGALLREGLNTKEKNLLRNNDMANYMEALDILQNEYGKPELVINDVNVDLDKLKPPTGEKAEQGFIAFVEKVENICRDMETISRSADLKNGHMINVLVRKLPAKVAQDWA